MADENSNASTTNEQPAAGEAAPTATTGATPAPPSERTFTEAEVNRIVADRVARAKAKGPAPTEAANQAKPSQQPGEWINDFNDAVDEVAEELGVRVPLNIKKRIRGPFQAELPEDPTAWVKGWLTDLGLAKAGTATATAPTTQPNQAPQMPQPVPPNLTAPSVVANVDEISDPRELMKPENFSRLIAKHGAAGAQSVVAKKAETWLRSVRIVPPASTK